MLLNFLFPGECVICKEIFFHRGQNVICPGCLSQINKNPPEVCRGCGRKISACICRPERRYDDFKVFMGKNRYITEAIYWLKIKKYRKIAPEIGNRICKDLSEFIHTRKIDTVTFIPLDRETYKERGFNHLEEILKSAVPGFLIKPVLKKTQKTRLQMELSAEERHTNLKGVFSLAENIREKNVLIFDDIITTGATMMEALKTVKKGRPSKIYGYVIAG
ncbi:ComF family protein [Persephonella sp.]|nr:ComF family protein [Aquificota bacterium]